MQALALPELITTARKPSAGVRAVVSHRRGEHQILRVHAGRRSRPVGNHQRQVVPRGIALDPRIHAGGTITLGTLIDMITRKRTAILLNRKRKNDASDHGQSHNSAVVSGNPYIKLKFCTAAPDAPLIKLSRQLIVSTRPRTSRTVMSQKFVSVVSFVPGR